MAIVVYKCDVCKREKEYIQNVEGIEKVQRCTITHGCRGKLFQNDMLPDYTRASAPDGVLGLDDWRQRKVLYDHTQTIARDEWIIKHNLGTFPSISVFVSIPIEGNPENLEEIQPIDTIIVDENNTILKFNRSWSGIAQLVARQSDPNLLKPFTRAIDETVDELQQISLDSDVAIATLISSTGDCSDLLLTVEYTTTQNTKISYSYPLSSNDGNSSSSWRDFERVVIKGKLFIVRSYDGFYSAMQDEIIGSGSTFKIVGISECGATGSPIPVNPIGKDEVYILFANKPYDTVDKDLLQYIDVADVTDSENSFALLYDSREFFAKKSVVQSTYPPIRVVL